uniref:Solute carrier family 22 member 7 n=1 Tax=Anas platyrhynchos platyrhynchos TaxID=8840 RepID=A0A493TUJ8_ANAPP
MKFEDLLLEIGGFGRFQILILFVLCLARINLPMHFLLHSFLAATPSHHCAIPHQEAFVNLTMEEILLISIPREPDGTFRSCEMFSQPQFHLLLNSSLQPENDSIIQNCQHGWVYDHSQFTSTISTQWDLVCEQRGLNQATATFFFIGVTIGAVVFGYLSDRFDPFQAVSSGLQPGTLSHFALLTKSRRPFPGEALCVPAERCLPLAGMEWVDIEHRTFSGVLTSIFWSIGNIEDPLSLARAMYVGWKTRSANRNAVFSPRSRWVPESARWLIANGKVKQAHKHLLRCARMNGMKDFALSPELTGFGLNMYLSQFVFGIIEIPAKVIVYVLVNRIGRRQSQAWSLILTGLCIGANIIIPEQKKNKKKFFLRIFLVVVSTTMVPSLSRQNGMGYTSFVARLGGALAPLVFLLDEVWRSLPEVTYCGVAVCCGSVAFLLPETLNVRLPEGIEDVEKTQ